MCSLTKRDNEMRCDMCWNLACNFHFAILHFGVEEINKFLFLHVEYLFFPKKTFICSVSFIVRSF